MDELLSRIEQRKRRFVARCCQRLAQMRALTEQRLTAEAMSGLTKDVHQMAGAAGIYELNEFAAAAIVTEELCNRLLAEKRFQNDSDRQALRESLQRLLSLIDDAARQLELDCQPAS